MLDIIRAFSYAETKHLCKFWPDTILITDKDNNDVFPVNNKILYWTCGI